MIHRQKWRPPVLCVCGARMVLDLIHDFWHLRCQGCGSVGTQAAKSLTAGPQR